MTLVNVWIQDVLPQGVSIVNKDLPILLDAITQRHSMTGDKQHFDHYRASDRSGD